MQGIQIFARRLKSARQNLGLTQEDVASLLGFKDRQTVSQIEGGERRMSANDLIAASKGFGLPLDYFTDPFLVADEAAFSWRRANTAMSSLDAFETTVGTWVGAYRELARLTGTTPATQHRLTITKDNSLEEASALGERFSWHNNLGNTPSDTLSDKIETCLGIPVLMADTVEGVSGAVCHLPDCSAIIINRRDIKGRRNFDLAHELFHALTWDVMPPAHIESGNDTRKNRVEKLADSFASGLLMPEHILSGFGKPTSLPVDWLNETASALGVTATALKWRAVDLGWLNQNTARKIPDEVLRNNGHPNREDDTPPVFGKLFMDVMTKALDAGHLSARRAASIMGLTVDDLADLCKVYGFPMPFDI